jgi:hypothetical protein
MDLIVKERIICLFASVMMSYLQYSNNLLLSNNRHIQGYFILSCINKILLYLTPMIAILYIYQLNIEYRKYNKLKRPLNYYVKPIEHLQGECSICLIEYNDNSKIIKIRKCEHIYHQECISEWIITNNKLSCPLCRIHL